MGRKPGASTQYVCGRCPDTFKTKLALKLHIQDHQDAESPSHECPGCTFFFPDALALERHQIQNSHWPTDEYKCDRCTEVFATEQAYRRHRKHGQPCCDAFHSQDWKKTPRPGYVDPDKPNLASKEVRELEYGDCSAGTPSNISDGEEYCHYCKKTFSSEFAYDRHLLGCTALNLKLTPVSPPETPNPLDCDRHTAPPSSPVQRHLVAIQVPPLHGLQSNALCGNSQFLPTQTMTLKIKAPASRQPNFELSRPMSTLTLQEAVIPEPSRAPAPSLSQAPSVQLTRAGSLVCGVQGCQRTYNSEQGLKMHQIDSHGIGGKGLDLYGKDSWMLGQRERERLKAEGLLRAPKNASRGGKSNRGGSRGGHVTPMSAMQFGEVTPGPYHQASRHNNINAPPPPLPTSQNIGGTLDMEQAKSICGKMLRLLLQVDIFIHHDGKMSIDGINWTRIGVERQPEVVGMFDKMCHLPRKLQSLEYVPAPKTFLAEYNSQYRVADFESAPARDPTKPGLGIIAIACSKITLGNGCYEVVKIAAVDVLTCRVLLSHLVCTDPNAQVTNWHSPVTGLSSFKDLEDARQAGYKVLKGWAAARTALFRFIDKETIVVGHNLRAELDVLRIIHGRAVDIAKVVEKAAQGPLSKIQVSLDSWCRDVANVARLKTDPVFGRDCVMSAFAAREIGLWSIKNQEKFDKVAKQKTKEYQFVTKA